MTLIIRVLVFLACITSLSGCAITHKFGPYQGKVVDAETQEPIEGAVVHMDFFSNLITPAGGVSKYIGSREVLTDKEGEFSITQRYWTFRFLNVWTSSPLLCIFKPGFAIYPHNPLSYIRPDPPYASIHNDIEYKIFIKKLSSHAARMKNLRRIFISPSAPPSGSQLILKMKNTEKQLLGL